jgi:2-oxoglutarate dehydrogenase E1 component
MSRQDANAAFAVSSFLYGSNAAYIEDIYARYEKDPSSVDKEWQEFFASLRDQPADVVRNAEGPSWEKTNWPLVPRDDTVSALDGNWAEIEKSVGTPGHRRRRRPGAPSCRPPTCSRRRAIRCAR